ncbi:MULTISPECIES: DNA cytosine methyltransferase [unclassified Sporosarcina]|uniref:DNA cytosine methyltransferase n=1 Tax=unclassified Sporosarcina TaxID=2647733 RepID=UPI002042462E|nr:MULTISPECIES: DNA cytosine methyltransferase [unclassified Sporosarcina]GKV66717.1 cytosine-specific methyltransferase [Sporosarcina sp. NCCP-2331]GLB57100.1 cytosine-specific methyltransferase [Sporosarcina sp. NCCP-2378]
MIKILELFGGIGAPRKALINLGVSHKTIDYVEWNEKAVRTYNAMFDNLYKPESVVGYSLQPDILVHGSPCQDFSIAGKQYGGNISDGTRSSLLFETIKIIESLGIWKPKFVIWENVKNALSKKMVSAFNHYMRDMEALGYTNSYEILDAREFGIPQARERIFTVSVLGDKSFDFSKLQRRPMQPIESFLENEVDEKYLITQPSMIRKLPDKPVVSGTYGGRMLDEVKDFVYTITTKQMRCPNSGVIRVDADSWRYLTERECWRLMGFDDSDFDAALLEHPSREGCLNGTLYHQAGNSIVVQILEAIFELLISGEYSSDFSVEKDGQVQLIC